MRVKFLKQTRHNDASVNPGDIAEVTAAMAERWFKHGIAGPVDVDTDTVEISTEDEEVPEPETDKVLKSKTVRELKEILEGLDERIPQQANKSSLVELINKARSRTGEGGDE